MMWIDNDNSVLILQTAQRMPDGEREAMEKRGEEKTGHAEVSTPRGVV